MEEEYLSPEIKTGIEPDKNFYEHGHLAEVEIKYSPNRRLGNILLIRSSFDAYNIIKPCFSKCMFHHEESWILLLNNNKPLGVARIGMGGISQTLVDERIMLQYMLKCNATGVILFHNHPSQNMKFSAEDLELTRRLKKCCEIMRLFFVDHIIVGEESYLSFSDEGL